MNTYRRICALPTARWRTFPEDPVMTCPSSWENVSALILWNMSVQPCVNLFACWNLGPLPGILMDRKSSRKNSILVNTVHWYICSKCSRRKQNIKHVLLHWQIVRQYNESLDVMWVSVHFICEFLVEPYIWNDKKKHHFKHFLSAVLSAAFWKCSSNPLTPAVSQCFIVKRNKILVENSVVLTNFSLTFEHTVAFEDHNIDRCQ